MITISGKFKYSISVPLFMKRKVVKHGPSTFIISLPSRWVKKYGIKKGEELDVTEDANSVVISKEAPQKRFELNADVTGLRPKLVDRFLARSYQKGADQIKITHNDIDILDTIRKKIHELIGYELIDQSSTTCTVQTISSRIELDFDRSLRRAFTLVGDMIQVLIDACRKKEPKMLKDLYLRDLEVNRLCYFCLRQLNKEHYRIAENGEQNKVLYYLIEVLEDLGDNIKELAGYLALEEQKEKMLELLEMLKEQYDIAVSYFYSPTKTKANDAYVIYMDIRRRIADISASSKGCSQVFSLVMISESSNIIDHYTTMRLDLLKE